MEHLSFNTGQREDGQVHHHDDELAEQQRTTAEIQAALTVAAARPRDIIAAIDRINTACERPRLAEMASYVFSRGGQEITGPSVRLLETIAGAWGNLQFGFRELSQSNGESSVEAFAWDLENNTKRSLVFTVPHVRSTKQGNKKLTDPRDIYELVANQAQRRVRSCLEAVIPRDIVEDAEDRCEQTLKQSSPVTPEGIKKLVAAFAAHSVTSEQIEKRLQRRLDTMTAAQMATLRRIYTSLKEGMSTSANWFELPEAPAEPEAATNGKQSATEKLKSKLKERTPELDAEATSEPVEAVAVAEPVIQPDSPRDAVDPLEIYRQKIRSEFGMIQGAARLRSRYDQLCGPEGNATADESAVITSEYELRRDAMAAKK